MKILRTERIWIVMLLLATACAGGSTTADILPLPTDAPTAAPTESPTEAPTQGPEPVVTTLTDGLGREFSFETPFQRIVSIAPSNTEIVFAVGAGDQLVGREDFADYPPEALEVPSIGSTYGELNLEAILGLDPDLILAAEITPSEQIQAMEEVGLQVFVISNPEAFEDLFANVETVGILTGHEPEAQGLSDELRARYETVLNAVGSAQPKMMFYEIDGTDPSSPWTAGTGTFQQLMITLAGGENVAADIELWGQINLEDLVVRDPEVILFATGPFIPTTIESLLDRPGWGEIQAVVNGEVYAIDTDFVDVPGPRLVDGLELMARYLHPELFE